MKAYQVFNEENQILLEAAIAKAEKQTSGEIRLHIEDKCREDVLDHAVFIFDNLEMEKTKERNGVLFYVAFADHKFAILGDVGINEKVPDDFWSEIKDNVIENFKQGQYVDGLSQGIVKAGEKLAEFFPHDHDGDTDELSNEISFGKSE